MQPVQSGGTDGHVDSCFGATSMKLEDERAIVSRKKIYLEVRHGRGVKRRATATAESAMREKGLVLRQTGHTYTPSPV